MRESTVLNMLTEDQLKIVEQAAHKGLTCGENGWMTFITESEVQGIAKSAVKAYKRTNRRVIFKSAALGVVLGLAAVGADMVYKKYFKKPKENEKKEE